MEIADPDICLRFTARVFEDVKIGPSPLWLKARLTAAGQRPISNVVDITNYVMLATAQPLHAFDLDRVRGGRIVVRKARDGETMTTLDGVERTFQSPTALVCDAEGPSGIAGIMGGQVSEVSDSTTRVLMEAATWVGPNILRSSAQLGLRTEASTRFEKQLHPEQAIAAQRLAARLMVELCGARLVPGTLDAYPAPLDTRVLTLRPARVAALLGTEVPVAEIRAILERLGFEVADGGGALSVTVPPWRVADVEREADLIEEVGAHLRPRPAADHAARAPPRGGPAHRSPAPAPPPGGRPARPRAERGRVLQLRRALHAGAAAPGRAGADRAGQPAERGPERDAPAAPARACSTPPATTRPTDAPARGCSSPRTCTRRPARRWRPARAT